MRNFTIFERRLGRDEYLLLRSETNWNPVSEDMVDIALAASLYSVVIYCDETPVAMGRIVGDGGLYFYLQDVVVHRDFRGQGLARIVMEKLESYLKTHANENAFVGLMAAEGVEGLYENFGYMRRNQDAPGMFKVWTQGISG